jgi:hypothetical protein
MITFRIIGPGVDHTEKAAPRDILRWELADHKRSISDFQSRQRYQDMYEIAWHLARRVNLIENNVPLAEFMNTFDVEPVKGKEEDPEDPKLGNPEASTTP